MRALRQLIGCPMPKNIDEIIKESIKMDAPFQHFATVIISEKDIIQGISQSKPNNLITDNFGVWLAGLLRQPTQDVGDPPARVSLEASDGAADNVGIYNTTMPAATENCCVFNAAGTGMNTQLDIGTQLQVGAGSTAADRGDTNVETAFGTAPEDAPFDTGAGSYAAGAISVAGAITAGGSGTIAETCFFALWYNNQNITVLEVALYLLFHDILVSTEAFVAAQTITCAYTINL